MSENFEPQEDGEDTVDLMSSLIREIAESGKDANLAQMVQEAKNLWQKGEHAAAHWILEGFRQGQENVLKSVYGMVGKVEGAGMIDLELNKEISKDDGMYHKLGAIIRKMANE